MNCPWLIGALLVSVLISENSQFCCLAYKSGGKVKCIYGLFWVTKFPVVLNLHQLLLLQVNLKPFYCKGCRLNAIKIQQGKNRVQH